MVLSHMIICGKRVNSSIDCHHVHQGQCARRRGARQLLSRMPLAALPADSCAHAALAARAIALKDKFTFKAEMDDEVSAQTFRTCWLIFIVKIHSRTFSFCVKSKNSSFC